MTQKIGVFTSGGDCAGLNACLRSIVHYAVRRYGWEVWGVKRGMGGLVSRPIDCVRLYPQGGDHILLRSSGTILGSTCRRDGVLSEDDAVHMRAYAGSFLEGYREMGFDAVIGIGGDGSMRILHELSKHQDISLVTIPKTIDNDLSQTEIAIGYATTLDVATQALDRLQSTAQSHRRVMILEVMGRDAGHIALATGIAGGADIILIPEFPYRIHDICAHIQASQEEKGYTLIVVAESVKKEDGESAHIVYAQDQTRYGGIGQYLGTKIEELTREETRVTVLGHVQRGAEPHAWDRIIASAFGIHAVDLVAAKRFNRMVAWQNLLVTDVAIESAIEQYHAVSADHVLIRTALNLGMYLGEVST